MSGWSYQQLWLHWRGFPTWRTQSTVFRYLMRRILARPLSGPQEVRLRGSRGSQLILRLAYWKEESPLHGSEAGHSKLPNICSWSLISLFSLALDFNSTQKLHFWETWESPRQLMHWDCLSLSILQFYSHATQACWPGLWDLVSYVYHHSVDILQEAIKSLSFNRTQGMSSHMH